MPPFVPRKRRSPSPEAPPAKRRETARGKKAPVDQKPAKLTKPKSSVFDAIDTLNTKATAEEAKNFFASVGKGDSDDEDDRDGSSSEDDDDDEFEDVPMKEAPKEQDDGEDMDWEDAIPATETNVDDDSAIQDINISINEDGSVAAVAAAEQQAKAKKGPSKRERQARIRAHCIHVQTLLFHNAVRNSWLNDEELHKILLDSLSQGVKDEIDRWKINMGMKQPPPKKKQKGKSKGNSKARDWGQDADRLEPGVPNLSAGDPLLRLLKVLTAYWRKRFQITAPGIRKQGHLPQRLITYEIKAWAKNKSNFERHGERIENIEEFRKLAKECRGSRDVGAQLFTALIRAIGIESRMIASLQPAGFGWTKFDEGEIKKQPQTSSTNPVEISDDESLVESPKPKSKSKAKKPIKAEKPARKSFRKSKSAAAEEESSELSSVPSDADDDDDASVIDITPAPPPKNSKKYDRDLAYPHYWTEVLSLVSNTYIPVDSIVLSTVASNQELLSTFEPRGKRADQARQVICYVIAHNQDTTCKDVTVRYLKKHQLPGRTKGFRMPVEKIPVLNKRGKVIKTEDYDFFKRLMSPFVRPQNLRTAADDVEESTDLKPFKPATEKARVATESLQWYKQSAEFVLERHLRREEAILPEAKQVRTFTSGKGDKEKSEPVYRRADVVNCKTVESWHKEGRQIKVGEQPLKMVPVRAVTLMRKREMEEAERETGEKLKQGLYGIDQTEWIIPPPIENGVIPKNAYNNIDVYVPSMVPKGAVHIPLRSTARICRKLNIDYAEACTGFEFGKQRAVPVITGVVVAAENEDAVIDAWEIEEAERKRKEDVKRQATNLHLWRKFLMGLRIVERIRSDYAGRPNEIDEVNPFVNRDKQKKKKAPRDEMTEGGGFLVDEDEDDDKHAETKEEDTDLSLGGGFLPNDEEEDHPKAEDADIEMGGGFLLDDDEDAEEEKKPVTSSHFAPMSLASAAHRQALFSDAEPVKDEEESEDEIEVDEAPPQRRNSRAAARPKAKPKAAPKAKAKPAQKSAPKRPARKSKTTIASSEEDEASTSAEDAESSLSDLTDASEDDEPPTKIKRRYSSPRVVISPRKRNGTVKKEVKSPYFSHTEDDGGGEVMDVDEDEEEESEEEVVKPRGTTRRTRGRG